jgi:flagellar biosynthesis protein FlhB
MAEEQDKEQKTEHPTPKRLKEAAEKGNILYSREVSNFLVLIVLAFTIGALAPYMLSTVKGLLIPFFDQADALPTDAQGLGLILTDVLIKSLAVLTIPVLFVIIAALLGRFMQSGFLLSFEVIAPKWSKLSPLQGIKRIFSMRSLVEMIKSILKLIIVGTVAFLAVYPQLSHVQQLPDSSVIAMMLFMGKLAIHMVIGIVIAMFFIAVLDYLYQRYQYFKSLRMTKQEVKDEYKQTEGDPVIKRRLRQLRMEKARQRMMANVPKADVVITNPTHFAVALQYDGKSMQAPRVVAKGQDLIALKIREVAEENDVPVVENPPLARALFDSTDIDEEIPIRYYEAVAKIISYVYQLKGRKL